MATERFEIPCYCCDGRGYFEYEGRRGRCPGCNGSGRILVDEIPREEWSTSEQPVDVGPPAPPGTPPTPEPELTP